MTAYFNLLKIYIYAIFFVTISPNMDSEYIKVDKKEKYHPCRVLHVSHYDTMPSSASFCHNALHIKVSSRVDQNADLRKKKKKKKISLQFWPFVEYIFSQYN